MHVNTPHSRVSLSSYHCCCTASSPSKVVACATYNEVVPHNKGCQVAWRGQFNKLQRLKALKLPRLVLKVAEGHFSELILATCDQQQEVSSAHRSNHGSSYFFFFQFSRWKSCCCCCCCYILLVVVVVVVAMEAKVVRGNVISRNMQWANTELIDMEEEERVHVMPRRRRRRR